MKLITEVGLPEYSFRFDHHTPSLFLGSCFTENIGRLMERWKFPVSINPFGVTYNPASVARQLEALMQRDAYGSEDLNHDSGRWFSFDHYTGFSSADQQKCLEDINQSFRPSKEKLQQASTLVLTWGTSWVYHYRHTGKVVCNCHKIPADQFTRARLSVREIINLYEALLPRLFTFNPHLKVLLTVSPVRHWKDGAHGNQLSKSALLLASEALEQRFPEQLAYFPSYEIVMDELRDYRFFADDMLHLNSLATHYIWEKFQGALLSEESQKIIAELEPLLRMEAHRSSDNNSNAHFALLKKLEKKRASVQETFPFLEL